MRSALTKKIIVCYIVLLLGSTLPSYAYAQVKKCCPKNTSFLAKAGGDVLICCNGPINTDTEEFNDTCCKEGAKRKGYNEVNIIEGKDGKKKCCLVKNPQQS